MQSQPALHARSADELVNWGIHEALVPHLRRAVRQGSRTLETGSGVSTIVLLALGAKHQSISPDPGEPERIKSYCKEHGISTADYEPIVGASENILPTLGDQPLLDLALIDGSHSFPLPCIDWFYATRLLKKGGTMIIDDVQLWSVAVLADFLDGGDAWEKLERTPRFAVYRLLGDARDVLGRWWGQQPHVVRLSRTDKSRWNVLGRLWGR
jgi:predicted O-methyltransferase YrrM